MSLERAHPISRRGVVDFDRAVDKADHVGTAFVEKRAVQCRLGVAVVVPVELVPRLREIQGLLRHKNIRTTVRYTHVGYEQTRQTAEALSQALE